MNNIENEENLEIDNLIKLKSRYSDPKLKDIKRISSANMKSLLNRDFTLNKNSIIIDEEDDSTNQISRKISLIKQIENEN